MVFGTQKLELELVHFLAPSFRIYVVVEKKKMLCLTSVSFSFVVCKMVVIRSMQGRSCQDRRGQCLQSGLGSVLSAQEGL